MTGGTRDSGQRTVTTHVVGSGDDAITYDIHGDLADATSERPALFVFGAPMDASGFAQLVEQIDDRPVVTYDPRGAGRNPIGKDDITTEQHAADLHHVIEALGAGPVDAFGSSGGAVTLLALAGAHPADVRRVVAHEPPLVTDLPDRDTALAAIARLKSTYAQQGDGPAMAGFLALVMHDGVLPAGFADQPTPDPAMFGMSADDDGSRTNPLFRNMPALNDHDLDADTLRALGDRLVIAAGVESGDSLAARGARAVAAGIGRPITDFPSHHGGFASQPGFPGDPEGFAARLREVLA